MSLPILTKIIYTLGLSFLTHSMYFAVKLLATVFYLEFFSLHWIQRYKKCPHSVQMKESGNSVAIATTTPKQGKRPKQGSTPPAPPPEADVVSAPNSPRHPPIHEKEQERLMRDQKSHKEQEQERQWKQLQSLRQQQAHQQQQILQEQRAQGND